MKKINRKLVLITSLTLATVLCMACGKDKEEKKEVAKKPDNLFISDDSSVLGIEADKALIVEGENVVYATDNVAEVETLAVSCLAIEECSADEIDGDAEDGVTYYKLNMQFENKSDIEISASSNDFYGYATLSSVESNKVYEFLSVSNANVQQDCLNINLAGGETATGYVYFNIPSDAENVVVVYRGAGIDKDICFEIK